MIDIEAIRAEMRRKRKNGWKPKPKTKRQHNLKAQEDMVMATIQAYMREHIVAPNLVEIAELSNLSEDQVIRTTQRLVEQGRLLNKRMRGYIPANARVVFEEVA